MKNNPAKADWNSNFSGLINELLGFEVFYCKSHCKVGSIFYFPLQYNVLVLPFCGQHVLKR